MLKSDVDHPPLDQIGLDDLWVVWSKVPAFLLAHDPTMEPVRIHWLLASPGPKGLAEIASEYPTSFIAAVPLSVLESVDAKLAAHDDAHPSWVVAAMGWASRKKFWLLKNKQGDIRVDFNKQSGDEVLLTGGLDDYQSLLKKGHQLLERKDWLGMAGDVRAHAQAGKVTWFSHQRTPEAAAVLQKHFEDIEG